MALDFENARATDDMTDRRQLARRDGFQLTPQL